MPRIHIPEVKDNRTKRWEVRTFMGMVAAMVQSTKWAGRGVGSRMNIRMPGFPLAIPFVGAHCSRRPDIRARKKRMRQVRQSRIRRRGWA